MYYASVISLNLLAIVNLYRSIMVYSGRLNVLLFSLTGLSLVAGYFLFRSFSLKVQDRAIRAEENLRHFALTGKLHDKNLKLQQIVALRFAPDEEFLGLTKRAIKENLGNKEIKKLIRNWKEDTYRA